MTQDRSTRPTVRRDDDDGPGDYRSRFIVHGARQDARVFALAVFGGAPPWFRLLLHLGWRGALRLRLDGPHAALGWRVDGDSSAATLTADGPWLAARNEVAVVADGLAWRTVTDYRTPIGRLLWTLAAPVHHLTLPWLLRRAAVVA